MSRISEKKTRLNVQDYSFTIRPSFTVFNTRVQIIQRFNNVLFNKTNKMTKTSNYINKLTLSTRTIGWFKVILNLKRNQIGTMLALSK